MRILVTPNAFKGSISAREICSRAAFLSKTHKVQSIPFSDGGDSILEVFSQAFKNSKLYYSKAYNAIGKNKKAPFLILADGETCILETAKICGLGELKKSELNFMEASSYGIGQIIKAAYKKGARKFYIGLGGVAFNDAGTGMAMALGYKFLDKSGKAIKKGVGALTNLAEIKNPDTLPSVEIYGLSDVRNPLLGSNGSAAVYGPQKGATQEQVLLAEKALKNLARIVKRDLGKNINTLYCGSAGALGAGLKGFLRAKLVAGAPFIAAKLGLNKAIKKADLIITGEGKLDSQSFCGKGPIYICSLATKYKKPVIFICGKNEIKDKALLKKASIIKILELDSYAGSTGNPLQNAGFYIAEILKKEFPIK